MELRENDFDCFGDGLVLQAVGGCCENELLYEKTKTSSSAYDSVSVRNSFWNSRTGADSFFLVYMEQTKVRINTDFF
jgi:hypothetical protein